MSRKLALDEIVISTEGMRKFNEGETNRSQILRMKTYLKTAIRLELTEKQRRYLLGYYSSGKTMAQLGRENGVSESDISKTIKRALTRLKSCTAYLNL